MRRGVILLVASMLLLSGLATRPSAASPLGRWNDLVTGEALTVGVDQPAVVVIEGAAVAAAGWPLDRIDPLTVQVWRAGVEQPAVVDVNAAGQVERLAFVAEANESPWSREAVYWLTYGRGLGQRLPTLPAASAPWRWEEDRIYEPLVASVRGDSWFAVEVRSGGAAAPLTLMLPAALPTGTPIELAVTAARARPGHRLELWREGLLVATVTWDDGAIGAPRWLRTTLQQPLPAGEVRIEVALTSTGPDRVLLDALMAPTLQQPRPLVQPTLRPHQPRDLRAGPQPGQAGASYLIIAHPHLIPALPPLIALKEAQGDRVGVVDVTWIYDAFSAGERDPAAIRAFLAMARTTWQPPPRAVLLVGGGATRMRGGPPPTPTPGLALSDAPLADPLLPPFLVRGIDPAGEIACDTCLVRFDTVDVRDDVLPDLPIGRIPARTLAEAETVIAKTVRALRAPPPGAWRGRVLLLADNDREVTGNPDPSGPFSPILADTMARLPASMQAIPFVYAPQSDTPPGAYASPAELRCRLFRAWDGGSPHDQACPPLRPDEHPGAALLIYVGHGSPWQWAATSPGAPTPYLLYLYDADGRTGGRLPIVLAMTCASANWANPVLQAMDERFLLWPRGGSVAVLGAVGSGVNTGHARMLAAAVPVLTASSGDRSLGAAHLAALRALLPGDRDLAYSFHILGDPDMTLPAAAAPMSTWLPLLRR